MKDWPEGVAAIACALFGVVIGLGIASAIGVPNVPHLSEYLGFVGAFFGVMGAYGAADHSAKRIERGRAEARSDAVHEVLRATAAAILLFEEADKTPNESHSDWQRIEIQAEMNRVALSRLIERPELTDGPIIAAAGAISLLDAVTSHRAEYTRPSKDGFARYATNMLVPARPIVPVVVQRARAVIDYAIRRKWPAWKRRYQDDQRLARFRKAKGK